jgi:hypothetical protein
MSDRDRLLDDLCRKPDDWQLRDALAAWFEDNGLPEEAACLRWMAENRKRPYHGTSPQATWFNADTVAPGLGDRESDVPGAVYAHLEGGTQVSNHVTFDDLKAAEEAFLAAWVKARKAGWEPPPE